VGGALAATDAGGFNAQIASMASMIMKIHARRDVNTTAAAGFGAIVELLGPLSIATVYSPR
jgi:hypothetical protein